MSASANLSQPFSIRPATPSDLQDALRVRQAEERADDGTPETTAERLASEWEALGARLPAQVWVAVSADGRLLAYAELMYDHHDFTPRIWSPADHGYRELEASLLARAERRAYELGAEDNAPSIQLFAQATSARPALRQALLAAGYTVTSTYEQMELTLDEQPPGPRAIEGIEIRPFAVGQDAEALYRADEEAFQDQRGHTPRSYERWRQRLNLSEEPVDPSLWLVAWDADDIAGMALGERIRGVGWIHHLGVRRPWRRRGLGEALTRAALGAFHRNGICAARLNVDADSLTNAHQLYRRVGFRAVSAYANYQKTASLT